MSVVYFDPGLGAAYSKGRSKSPFLSFCKFLQGFDVKIMKRGKNKFSTYLRQMSAMLFVHKECAYFLGRADTIKQVGSESLSLCSW